MWGAKESANRKHDTNLFYKQHKDIPIASATPRLSITGSQVTQEKSSQPAAVPSASPEQVPSKRLLTYTNQPAPRNRGWHPHIFSEITSPFMYAPSFHKLIQADFFLPVTPSYSFSFPHPVPPAPLTNDSSWIEASTDCKNFNNCHVNQITSL